MVDSVAFTPAGAGTPDQGALCGLALAVLIGIVAVAALVVLAGCLTGYAEAMGYVWPADAQLHRMVDERR